MHEYLKTREPAVAGRFYPGEPHRLRHEVESLLKHARVSSTEGESPKALIAPHAGYVYSGPVAASGYALWVAERQTIRRIVLMGPAHFADFQGLALPSAAAFATPLGSVRIDPEGVAAISALPQVKVNDDAHGREHSLEVHLPFLQVILGEFTLVPLAVGRATPEAIREVVERLWGGSETRFVISSDLSHYLDSESARELDALTAEAIEEFQRRACQGEFAQVQKVPSPPNAYQEA